MLGVCYYPEHWPESLWADDARRMRAMGIGFVRIGEFAWSRIEPEAGRLELAWLRRALDTLGAAGLKVVLGTPTATPPKWLMDRHPEIAAVDREGRPRGFGSRRHYSFSSDIYWRESARIVEILAREFGTHAAVAGWQTDNEYGCHDTILSWGEADLRAFRDWLGRRVLVDGGRCLRRDRAAAPDCDRTESRSAARLLALRVRTGRRLQSDAGRDHPRALAGSVRHPQFHGLLSRFRSFRLRRAAGFRELGFLSDRLRRELSVHRGGAPALGADLTSRHRAIPPRSLSRRRARPLVADGAAARAGELGAVERDPPTRAGQAVHLGS